MATSSSINIVVDAAFPFSHPHIYDENLPKWQMDERKEGKIYNFQFS
jgi:hypothetical protein